LGITGGISSRVWNFGTPTVSSTLAEAAGIMNELPATWPTKTSPMPVTVPTWMKSRREKPVVMRTPIEDRDEPSRGFMLDARAKWWLGAKGPVG
jgi:hypothetical protein